MLNKTNTLLIILITLLLAAAVLRQDLHKTAEVMLVLEEALDEPGTSDDSGSADEVPVTEPPFNHADRFIYIRRDPPVFFDSDQSRLMIEALSEPPESNANYLFNEHTVVIPDADWKRRRVPVKDHAFVREIILDGPTLTLVCERSCFQEIIVDESGAYMQLIDPKEIYETIIVIDAGHGGDDYGAIVDHVNEKDLNLDMVLQLVDLFESENILLLPTRIDDRFVTLEDRYALANALGDYFISVHNNVDERSRNTRGTKTYFHTHEGDTPITSRELAETVQAALVNRLGTRDRDIEYAQKYRLLINTVIPSVIAEIMFMTNAEELSRLSEPDCRQAAAQGLYDAILALPAVRDISNTNTR